jgi:hypothetical protein
MLLVKHNITKIYILAKKTLNTLRMIKDDLGLRKSGVYCIPCDCGEVYGARHLG